MTTKLKSAMLRHWSRWLFLLAFACDEPMIDRGPCPFAPPESRFPVIEAVDPCDECYFNIQMMDKQYEFAGKQFETSSKSIVWSPPELPNLGRSTSNSFFDFHFIAPQKAELLVKSVGVKTRLLKVDTLFKLKNYVPPPTTVALRFYNYCNNVFEAANTSINQSFHRVTKVDLIESYKVQVDGDPFSFSIFYCYGEIESTFNINGQTELVKANYKLKVQVYER